MAANTDTKVITGKVRLSFVHLFEPGLTPSGEERYSALLLIPKSDKETVKNIKRAQAAALEAGLGPKFGGKKPPNLKSTFRDGDDDPSVDPEKNPEYEGMYFINVSSKTRPGLIYPDGEPITNSEELYSGCYARVSINFYAYNTSGNKGISAGLNNVMKLADGDYLGSRASAQDDFADYISGAAGGDDYDELLGEL
jgi:hypothetical protein